MDAVNVTVAVASVVSAVGAAVGGVAAAVAARASARTAQDAGRAFALHHRPTRYSLADQPSTKYGRGDEPDVEIAIPFFQAPGGIRGAQIEYVMADGDRRFVPIPEPSDQLYMRLPGVRALGPPPRSDLDWGSIDARELTIHVRDRATGTRWSCRVWSQPSEPRYWGYGRDMHLKAEWEE